MAWRAEGDAMVCEEHTCAFPPGQSCPACVADSSPGTARETPAPRPAPSGRVEPSWAATDHDIASPEGRWRLRAEIFESARNARDTAHVNALNLCRRLISDAGDAHRAETERITITELRRELRELRVLAEGNLGAIRASGAVALPTATSSGVN